MLTVRAVLQVEQMDLELTSSFGLRRRHAVQVLVGRRLEPSGSKGVISSDCGLWGGFSRSDVDLVFDCGTPLEVRLGTLIVEA